MKKKLLFVALTLSGVASAQMQYSGQLTKEEQPYYTNESGTGMNQLERIDSSVREINKIHGELARLKSDVAKLKAEVEELKKKK